jgi:hypothetical protein
LAPKSQDACFLPQNIISLDVNGLRRLKMSVIPLGAPRATRWLVVNLELSKREDETILTIGGGLLGSDLAELQRVRGGISGPVMLSFRDLLSADEENLRELRDWIAHGARTQGASPYLQLLLEQKPSPDTPEDPHP